LKFTGNDLLKLVSSTVFKSGVIGDDHRLQLYSDDASLVFMP
jgi:hypothetical protein